MDHFPIGQGHGVEGRYAGLNDAFSDRKESKIVMIPVPFDLTTTYQHGTENGPDALIEASRNMELYDIETHSTLYQIGIHTAQSVTASSSEEMRKNLYLRTKEFLSEGKFVVTIGGEHSISYSPIQAHVEKFPGMSILQIDAHADLQHSYEGNPWSHACVMARVRELPNISSIVAVGIRSMSQEEAKVIDSTHTFYGHELDQSGKWVEEVVNLLSDKVYLTFDLDGFDCSLMPSTGTPEPGGLNWNQAMALLKRVAEKKQLVGFDVVELCPSPHHLAPDYLAAKLIYKILSYHHFYHPMK
ncbi:MAG: agmatinase [Parachlamydiaceae bacterium]